MRAALTLLTLFCALPPAFADGPGPGRPAWGAHERVPTLDDESGLAAVGRARPRPQRRVMDGPDYAGSSFGLGKPAFSGIGPRPDWGRSSID